MRIKHVEIRNFRGIKSLSWHVKGNFNCIIGPGDTCKTTILTALDHALSPRSNLTFDDPDFFDQDVNQSIVIQVTLTNWDETQRGCQTFLSGKQVCASINVALRIPVRCRNRHLAGQLLSLSLCVLTKVSNQYGRLLEGATKQRILTDSPSIPEIERSWV